MSLLRELEQRLEALFEGFFTRQFKSGVQPVEIAKKLTREMDAHRTVSVKKVYVPNRYVIYMSPEDAEKLRPFAATLITELRGFLMAHAKKEGYELVGRPAIELKADERLKLGELALKSSLESRGESPAEEPESTTVRPPAKPAAARHAFLVRAERGGETKFQLTGRTVGIGRAPDNAVVIPDPNVSRHHASIEHAGAEYVLRDQGSTNGTFVNGVKVGERALKEGDTIVIGTTRLHFRRERRV